VEADQPVGIRWPRGDKFGSECPPRLVIRWAEIQCAQCRVGEPEAFLERLCVFAGEGVEDSNVVKFDHARPVEHLRAEGVCRFVDVDRADDEDVARKRKAGGHGFVESFT
jgi:hypothetical protein